ncbi:unnamed protein product [Nezara viridula]|uniref:Uncharacterized protein n=1 Tax=Nezara viridula TaxID=85310 RepID=A0A9P0MRM7_NEZVI|nr:unnamed protein product [Nezara viridula]
MGYEITPQDPLARCGTSDPMKIMKRLRPPNPGPFSSRSYHYFLHARCLRTTSRAHLQQPDLWRHITIRCPATFRRVSDPCLDRTQNTCPKHVLFWTLHFWKERLSSSPFFNTPLAAPGFSDSSDLSLFYVPLFVSKRLGESVI